MNKRIVTIIAFATSLLAVVFFAVRNYQLLSHLEEYNKLVIGDQYFIEGDIDSAFYWYDQLNQDLLVDDFYTYRELSSLTDSELTLGEVKVREKVIGLYQQCTGQQIADNDTLTNEELLVKISDCLASLKKQKLAIANKSNRLLDSDTSSINEGFLQFKDDKGDKIYYFGEKLDSMANGFGKGIWSNENIYEGEWKNNLRHGQGVFRTKYGDFYEGEYYNGQRNGFGTYYFRNGDFYTGDWKDGKRSGFGTVLSAAGDTLVHGFWENDKFDRRRTRREGI